MITALYPGSFDPITNGHIDIAMEFARDVHAQVIVRGLRMIGDFEWEFEMAMMNQLLSPGLETVCFMASQEYQFLSASLIKEVANLGGPIVSLVPPNVIKALKKKGLGKK
jgi:pantetheine-phosphate adenylyltransferase